ncbi:MAG TPA: hypothetical protein VGS07_08160 [Thermoanaerobaculia bacterium]|jgi:hypothetical protein|nr:hypothetical protein [Thermoanaerobaculia bacterium]
MIKKKQVVIFDDEASLRQEWADKLSLVRGFTEEFEVQLVANKDFEDALDILRIRRKEAREKREVSGDRTLFDETSILIVDYDLFPLNETGEEVAYLARCFSGCGTIVGVNQFAREGFTFDLTLQGHPDSFADLNLLVDQVFEPGLWNPPWEGFRPWYWPLLAKATERFEIRVKEALENLDVKILDFFEIPDKIREIFPISALEFFSSEDATLRSFVENSGMALRRKDKVPDQYMARVAAARLFKCLERIVLPGQNILVDATHLLERYPSLFRGGPEESLIDWPHTHELLAPEEEVMDVAKLEGFRFAKSSWLSRTAWYWPLVSEHEQIAEVVDPWAPRSKLAFCEDTSRFVSPDDAAEFVAKVDSPFSRRFVSTRHSDYGPQLQFAL